MIADTNVPLLALDGGQTDRSAAARAHIARARETGKPLAVLACTVIEVAHVLSSVNTGYARPRETVAKAVTTNGEDPGLDVEAAALRAAVESYRSRSVDLHNCLVSALAAGCGTVVLSI